MSDKISGIILAGGRSSRMGTNKAFLRLQLSGSTLIEMVIDKVKRVAETLILVTNTSQEYQWLHLPIIRDNFPGAGPLAGIETGLNSSQTEFNLVVACDMPYLSLTLLQLLAQTAFANPDAEAVVPLSSEGFPEPLCAVYSQKSLSTARSNLQKGDLKIKNFLDAINTIYLSVDAIRAVDPTLQSFVNLNTPADLPHRDS